MDISFSINCVEPIQVYNGLLENINISNYNRISNYKDIERFQECPVDYSVSDVIDTPGIKVFCYTWQSYFSLWNVDIPVEVRPYLTFWALSGHRIRGTPKVRSGLFYFDVQYDGPADIGLMWRLSI